MTEDRLLRMQGIHKAFHGVQALLDVGLAVAAGEVHALLGENGAGKSTLVRILNGVLEPDAGEIILRGKPVEFHSPRDAEVAGIAMIHQELSLVPPMSVAENIFLGREPRTAAGFVDYAEMHRRAAELLDGLGLDVDVREPVEAYSIATQQMVEVAKVLSQQADIIVMDEPTSALSEGEAKRLFSVIRDLRDRGVSVIYITHKMEEIYEISDRITVLRDGEFVDSARTADVPPEQLIVWMVGRKIEQLFPKVAAVRGELLLRAEGITLRAADGSDRRLVDGVSLSLHAGEVVGIAGLQGSGNSELLGSLFGQFGARAEGRVEVLGRPVDIRSPGAAIEHGVALLTNDRKTTGLVLSMSVLQNLTLASLPHSGPGPFVSRAREGELATPIVERLAVRASSIDADVSSLSGGNQQKVALGKWLMTEPCVFLLDEPTRGIDVGAKAEVYSLMNDLAAEGRGILLITSELPELLAMSDRILVMHRGRVTAEFSAHEATQEKVMAAAMEA